MEIILYSTHCPKCNVLKKLLQEKKIDFKEVNDKNVMIQKGFTNVPVLEVDGNYMNFKTAFDYIKNQGG